MPVPGFFDENSDRDYPFIYGQDMTGTLSDSSAMEMMTGLIVDFRCEFGPRVAFSTSDYVSLSKISRLGGVFSFEFTTSALPDHQLMFQFEQGDAEFTTQSAVATTTSPDPTCDDPEIWVGHLTIGRILPLLDMMASPDTWTPTSSNGIQVEPGLVTWKYRQFVDAVTIGNKDRTRFVPPSECSLSSSSTDPTYVFLDATCLKGSLTFREGYNCSLRVSEIDNSLTISAIVGAGEGEPCDEVPIFPGEQPPPGSPFLSGGDACKDIIATIDGLSAEEIFLVTTPGLEIVQTGENELTIRLTGDGLAVSS